jgi:hypothetical protein
MSPKTKKTIHEEFKKAVMNIYTINNKKYNVNFNLKLDSVYDFIQSLKESKQYYHDYCNLKNINIIDFDNEYIENINILKSDLLKYYILINDNDVEKYVIINDTIKEMYNVIIKINNRCTDVNTCEYTNLEIIKYSLNINYLTKQRLSSLIKIYAFYYNKSHFYELNIDKVLLSRIGICNSITEPNENNTLNLNKYLNTLKYESIYEKELDKILINLPDICISNIKSKKIIPNNNQQNLIDLNDECQHEFVKID